MLGVVAAAALLAPVGSNPSAAQSSGDSVGGTLVVVWGGSLSDVGTAASLVAAGEGAAVVYAESPQSLGFDAAALVEQVAPVSVVLVGGTAVLEESIETELRGLAAGVGIDRLAGASRIGTAALAAERVLGVGETVVIANGWSLPDVGAAAAAVAAGVADAVLYADKNGLGDETRRVLSEKNPSSVLIAGGTAALSDRVASESAAASGRAPRRLGGATRVETAALISRQALDGGADVAVVANGWSLSDVGIAASLAAGVPGSAVLYAASADDLGDATKDALDGRSLRRVFVVGASDMVDGDTFARLQRSAPSTRIEASVRAARHVLGLAGAPDLLGIVESETVGVAGATIEAAGVQVVVPAGAVSSGTEVRIRERQSLVQFGTAWAGLGAVEVDSAQPVKKPIVVSWDVGGIDKSSLDSVVLVRWDDTLGSWVSGYSEYDIRDGKLIAQIDRWSIWDAVWCGVKFLGGDGCVAEAIAANFDPRYLSSMLQTSLQTSRELSGRGVDKPQCSSSPAGLPQWVRSAGDPEDGDLGRLSAFRLCYEREGSDGFASRLAANGVLSYYAYADASQKWGEVYSEPSLDETPTSLVAIVHRAAHELLTNSERVFVPALKTVDAKIVRPGPPGTHTADFEGKLDAATVLVDMAVFAVSSVSAELSPSDEGDLETAAAGMIECGLPEADAIWNTVSGSQRRSTKAREVLQQVAGKVTECGDKTIEDLADSSNDTYETGTRVPANNPKVQTMARGFAKGLKHLKILEAGGYVIELVERLREQPTKWTVTADVPLPPNRIEGLHIVGRSVCKIGDETPSCPDHLPLSLRPKFAPSAYPSVRHYTIDVPADTRYISVEIDYDDKGRNGTLDIWPPRDYEEETPGHQIRFEEDQTETELSIWLPDGKGNRADNPYKLTFRKNDGGARTIADGSPLALGAWHSCMIRSDGAVACWGDDTDGKVSDAPKSGIFTSITAGRTHTCAIRTDQAVHCWGNNDHGQSTPPDGRFTKVTIGSESDTTFHRSNDYSCGLKTSGEIRCWGGDTQGQIDRVPSGSFTALASAVHHSCAIKHDQTVRCWGEDGDGHVGDVPDGSFANVYTGNRWSCGIKSNGQVRCWGTDRWDLDKASIGRYRGLAHDNRHICGITLGDAKDSYVECWGSNVSGKATPPPETFKALSAGENTTCGIRTDGSLVCWGSRKHRLTPDGSDFEHIASGRDHSCAVRTDRTVACWGSNQYGQTDVP